MSVAQYARMDTQLLEGTEVTLRSASGLIRRIVVKDLGDVLAVTSESEYRRAKLAGTEPVFVGFRRSDAIDLDRSVLLKHNVQYEQAEHGEAGPNRQGPG